MCNLSQLAAAAMMLYLLTACSSKDETRPLAPAGDTGASAAAKIDEEAVVNVYNWADYIDPALLEKFTAETGIKVNYDVYDSNELLETKLMAGGSGYDVVVPSANFVERQIKVGAFRKLDRSKIPNWRNFDPEVMRRLAQHDPGNEHAVSYMWGTNGIGYDAAKVQAIMPEAPVDSWALVFDPAIASRFKDCGISVLDAPVDMASVALIYLGKDPNSESPEDLELVEQTLMAVRPYIRLIDAYRYVDALVNGEICVAVGWNGSVMQARDRAIDAGQDRDIRYSIPKEGTIIWFDALAIPRDAPHPENAHVFIDFIHRADVAAANSNFIKFANGNAASYELVDESVRTDPSIYPPAEVRAKLHPDLAESEAYSRLLNRSWTRFVTGE